MDSKIEQLLDREGLTLAPLQARVLAYVLDICILSFALSFIFWEEFLTLQIALDSSKLPKDMMIEIVWWVFVFCMV